MPPPRFSQGRLKERDVDFCYGSCDGTLWPVLDTIFHLGLRYDNSRAAVTERQQFLIRQRIGICDIVESCRRSRMESSDLGMMDIRQRDILRQLELHPTITTLIFTGGNSKNGPEYLFRRQLKEQFDTDKASTSPAYGPSDLQLHCVDSDVPRKHQFTLCRRTYTTVSLTSPSNAANRAIGSSALYKRRKRTQPSYTTFDFRVDQYRQVFWSSVVD
ncbi:uracil-DNA glycosylase family protein [Desulfocastanea catecholica]